MAATREVTLKLGIDFTEGTATQKALASIGETASAQAKEVLKLRGALDAAGKVRLAGGTPDFAGISDAVKAVSEAQKELGASLQEQGRLKAVESIEASYRDQEKTLVNINAMLDPSLLKKRVELALEEKKAREALTKATDAEVKRQGGGPAIGSQILSSFGTVGKSVAAFADSGKGEGLSSALGVLGPAAIAAGVGLAGFASVAKASPGAMERLSLAFDDTAAVVGQTLIPVVEFITSTVKTFGDILATVLPPADSLREILAPIAETFRSLAEALAPVFELIQNVLIVALKGLAIAVNIVLIPFRILAEFIKGFLGGEDAKLKSSTGAAARSISFTSAESGAKSFYAAAYRTGQAGGGEYQSPLAGIKGTLDEILSVTRSIGQFLGAVNKINPVNTFKNFSEGLEIRERTRKLAGEVDAQREGILKEIKGEIDKSGGKLAPDREKTIREVLGMMRGRGGSIQEISDKALTGKDKADRLLDELNGNRDMSKQGFKS